jgi:hypothetical protein
MHAKRHSRFAKSDDDVSFPRDVREKRPKKLEGAGHPATPSGPPLTNTLQAPGRNPLTGKRDRLESPSTAGLAPKGRLTYLEQCGKWATTNNRRTMSDSLRRPT